MHVNVETQMSYAVSQRANQSPTGLYNSLSVCVCVCILCKLKSCAKINISDASFAERIVSVMGSTSQILKAFSMIAAKFEDVRMRALVILH